MAVNLDVGIIWNLEYHFFNWTYLDKWSGLIDCQYIY